MIVRRENNLSLIARIITLKQKKEALLARLALAEAQQAREERALETRRKILIGAAVLAGVRRGTFQQDQLMKLLSENLSEKDKKAFRI